jgi:hypothetical protein
MVGTMRGDGSTFVVSYEYPFLFFDTSSSSPSSIIIVSGFSESQLQDLE